MNAYQEQTQPVYSFKQKLKKAGEEGLLIFIKWGLALILAFLVLQFGTQIVSGSINGTQSALYLNELQNKGYLPKVVNGQVPPKAETQESKNEATSK